MGNKSEYKFADVYESELAAMQTIVDAAKRGVRFGKSRLIQNGRVMVGQHGVKLSVAKERQRQEHKRWMREVKRVKRVDAAKREVSL
jgi:hypothetical protein